jgi:16S rRNA processing protein RimM
VAVKAYNPDSPTGLLTAPKVWLLSPPDPPRPVAVSGRTAPFGLILKIRRVTVRDDADALKNLELAVARDDLPPLDEGEYYQADLLGLAAYLDDGRLLGQVAGLLDPGGALVLVVRDEDGSECLVPFSDELVPEVDLAAGRLTVANWPGLIPSPKSP